MKIAFVFPGQGSQFVGMGKDFVENFPTAKAVFDEVDDSLEEKLSDIIFNGPIETLTLTENTQASLMATSIAILKVIEQETGRKIDNLCDVVAGHSLGEFTALAAARSLSIGTAAHLLKIRGSSMQEAVPIGKGAMAAILGMDFQDVQKLCDNLSDLGICQIANDNCPGQIVISGEIKAITKAVEIAKESGKKAIILPVSAPFHSKLMKPVQQIMQNALSVTELTPPLVPLIANVTAREVTDPVEIKKNLVEQVTQMVRWTETIEYLIAKGIDTIVEIGAGKVLTSINKRMSKDLKLHSVGSVTDLKEFLSQMAVS